MTFDPAREAGDYIAPQGLYEQNKQRPFLGTLSCAHNTLVAGEWTELVLTYEVGGIGLADGAWLKLAFKFYSDWALFQTSNPQAANYVSAEYHAGALLPGQSPATVQQLKVRFDQKGHERPFQKAVIVDIVDGYLNPGDRIVIRLGDRRQGGGGTRVQSFVEKDFRFRMFIDPLGSSKFAEVPGDVTLDIVPGAPAALQLIAPRLLGTGEAFDVIVRADDIWGNTCRDLPQAGTLHWQGPDGALLAQPFVLPATGWAALRLPAPPLGAAGEWRVQARAAHGPAAAAQAFVTLEDTAGALRPLYADLHVHSDDTIGTNDTLYNLSYGRDVAGLDVLGYTANDFNITEARWDSSVALIHRLNEPGRFVCFPGTEWCGNSSAGGDRNVVFLHGRKPEFPFDEHGRMVRSIEWNEHTQGQIKPGTWPVDELYAAYAKDPAGHLMMPHVGGRRCNLDWHHPELERLIEVGSAWGQFHWVYAEALERGYRMGAAANSDEHQGRCGGGVPATAVFGSRGGLTGVLATRFEREAVGQALRARRTFATTGERSHAALWQGQQQMGEVYSASAAVPLQYRLLGEQGWEEISLYRGEQCIWQRNLHQELGLAPGKVRVRLGGARIKDRYRGAYWHGEISVRGAVVQDFRAFGFDHPEQTCWRSGATSIAFSTVTSGDQDSIELDLSGLGEGVEISVHARIDSYTKVGDPLQPQAHPHDPHAGLTVSGAALQAQPVHTRQLAGTELHLTVERITAAALPRDVHGEIDLQPLQLPAGREHPLFITARQRDQSRVWTSALFVTLD
ncbi:Protein of unknown function [Andreprevotia lacus DSM 23236]|jgi:hypothetical protein|uniref:DUF3604 domain-containing protein n=1 Tax=Andreprevotia lacus DSM 23236 TaxID=1121001 RepID=A0A1W1Y0E9_9NEIS|nr:DUF3604 domain-containing protein [Andreprevotia lacus]SMC29605.1 Protein of unknown function [Andreprevotia lacus DSM 23236]